MQRRQLVQTAALTLFGSPLLLAHAAGTPGVSRSEIVIGSIQDLSGPLASFGKPTRDGMVMRVEETNAKGGVNGRKINLLVEDSAYDTKRAVLAADKLVSSDNVFAVVGTLGSTPALSTMQTIMDSGALHLFPVTASKAMYEPFDRLKFAAFTPYSVSTRIGLKEALKRGYKRVAILYQDDDFGLDVLAGAEAALKETGLTLVERTTYKRGATDFSSQMAKLKAADPQLIVLATIVRETIGAMTEARKIGYAGDFFGSQSTYIPATPKIGGKAVDGLLTVVEIPTPYRDNPANNKQLNDWMDAYKARFGSDADLAAVFGWFLMDMFIRTAEKAGPGLTTDSFVKALESTTFAPSFLGSPEISFSATKRLGNSQCRLAQIRDGRWVTVSDFVK